MRLKILFFPLALLVVVVASIWYVYPAYKESMAKRSVLESRQKQLASLSERVTRINDLAATLDASPVARDFLFRYVPFVPDEEHIINAIDDAAKRAAVNLITVDVLRGGSDAYFSTDGDDDLRQQGAASQAAGARQDNLIAVDAAAGAPLLPIRRPAVRELRTNIVASGTYDNLKKFLAFIGTIDRLYGVVSAEIDRGDDTAAGEATGETLMLQSTVAFAYMGHTKIPRNADGALYAQDLDLDAVNTIRAATVAPPALSTDVVARQNPFVKATPADIAAAQQAQDAGSVADTNAAGNAQ